MSHRHSAAFHARARENRVLQEFQDPDKLEFWPMAGHGAYARALAAVRLREARRLRDGAARDLQILACTVVFGLLVALTAAMAGMIAGIAWVVSLLL